MLSTIFALLLASPAHAAPCPMPVFTDPQAVHIQSNSVLIVTHPSTMWDGRFSTKAGMDAAVKFAKDSKFPVIYLQGADSADTYFFGDCQPDYDVQSAGGEFSFAVPATHVYSAGGHWELCQKTSQEDLMRAWAGMKGVDLTYTQVLDGIYSYGAYAKETDPYYHDFKRFLEIIKYANPRGDWNIVKLSLLEMMGVIKDAKLQIDYLKRNLPPYQYLDSSYEVDLVYNDQPVEIVRPGQGAHPPKLRLEFVNSLYRDGDNISGVR